MVSHIATGDPTHPSTLYMNRMVWLFFLDFTLCPQEHVVDGLSMEFYFLPLRLSSLPPRERKDGEKAAREMSAASVLLSFHSFCQWDSSYDFFSLGMRFAWHCRTRHCRSGRDVYITFGVWGSYVLYSSWLVALSFFWRGWSGR